MCTCKYMQISIIQPNHSSIFKCLKLKIERGKKIFIHKDKYLQLTIKILNIRTN